MSSTIPLPPREQLYNRYCSNKHTPFRVGRAPARAAPTAAVMMNLNNLNNFKSEPPTATFKLKVGLAAAKAAALRINLRKRAVA
jgi:hypothetical protein